MSQIPLLPQQQITTTRYEPENASVAFRPQLNNISEINSQLILNETNASNETIISTTSRNNITSRMNTKQILLHRASHIGKANRYHSRFLNLSNNNNNNNNNNLIPPEERALYWLLYQEEQERAFIQASSFAKAPTQCYSSENNNIREIAWTFMRESLILSTDEELSYQVQKRFDNIFKINNNNNNSKSIWNGVENVGELQEEEFIKRQKELEEPWEQGYREIQMFQELLKGRLKIWNDYLKKLEIWQQMMHLIKEEKKNRALILSKFISCKTPIACRCLLWDLEILENSSIPLEPEVNIICLFTSIIIGENNDLQNSLLSQRERDLFVLRRQERLEFRTIEEYNRICKDEQERFETLLGYNTFCLNIAQQQKTKKVNKTESLTFSSSLQLLHNSNNNNNKLKLKNYPNRNQIRRQRGSPFIDFFIYLRICKTLCVEQETRADIKAYENMELSSFFKMHETAYRRDIIKKENIKRCEVIEYMENWEREVIKAAEIKSLKKDIHPNKMRHRARALAEVLKVRKQNEFIFNSASIAMQLLIEYEHQRRGEIMLLETKLRTESRLLFYNLSNSNSNNNKSKIVQSTVNRWMLEHEIQIIIKEEAKLRLRIEADEKKFLIFRGKAHEWMIKHAHFLSNKMYKQELENQINEMINDELKERKIIESEWIQEKWILFNKKLSVPVNTKLSVIKKSKVHNSHKAKVNTFDIRQIVITDLLEFLDDNTLLTIF